MFKTMVIDTQRLTHALTAFRFALAVLIGIHGWYRFLTGGAWLFGQYLNDTGWPFGNVIAWSITLLESFGMLAVLLNRFVLPICLAELFVLCMGVYLVHAPAGWFVVGAGRNGVEYSMLLISGLIILCYLNWPLKQKNA